MPQLYCGTGIFSPDHCHRTYKPHDSKSQFLYFKEGDKGNLTGQTFFQTAEYIRLSKEDGDKAESDSIGNQRRLINDYIKEKAEFVLYNIYVDDGFSGTNFNRPAFCRMIDDIEAGKVNCVIVKDLSRFGRDYIDTGRYLERYFPDRNVRFISITDNIDSFRQAYDMLLPIKNIFNEQYARDISRKIHAAVLTKQKAGEFIGAFASYGYRKSPVDKNKLVIDPYAAKVVRRIFELYLKGYGKNRIAAVLNEEKIPCPSEYKSLNGDQYRNSNRLEGTSYWTYSTINRILQNEMYTGNMVQGRKKQQMRSRAKAMGKENWIIVSGTHEAVIDKDTWEQVQNLLKRRTRSLDLKSNTSIFAGFLRCGDCGRALVKKTGKTINYFCGTYVRSGRQYCTPHMISHEILEKILLDDLKEILCSVENLEELAGRQKRKQMNTEEGRDGKTAEKEKIRLELDRIYYLKKAVYEDYRENLISKNEFTDYRQDYIKKEALLEKQLTCLEEKDKNEKDEIAFEIPWIRHLMDTGKIEALDRDIVAIMLHEIKVYENKRIKITYNFAPKDQKLL